jgi:hypothetical protein
MKADRVSALSSWLLVMHGVPGHIGDKIGTELTAQAGSAWLGRLRVETLLMQP